MSSPSIRGSEKVDSSQCCFVLINNDEKCDTRNNIQTNFFKISRCGSKVQMQRPATNLKKIYCSDGIFKSSTEINQACMNFILPNLLNDKDILIWTFGTRTTGKTTLIHGEKETKDKHSGYIGRLCHEISQSLLLSENSSCRKNEETGCLLQRTYITFSFLAVTADESDRAYDCLSSNCEQMKIRQNKEGIYYVENQEEIMCQDEDEFIGAFHQGSIQLVELKNRIGMQRFHTLVSFKIFKKYDNNDISTKQIQILDLCGASRPTPTKTHSQKGSTQQKNASSKLKEKAIRTQEDRTLKAMTRVVDSLSNNQKHVPWRDSKVTKLVSHILGGSSKTSLNVVNICISAAEGMFDEARAMMEFAAKLKKITITDKGNGIAMNKIRNREKDIALAHAKITEISTKLGYKMEQISELKSNEIELDMNSSFELVELRDELVKLELLREDDIQKIVEMSKEWWSCHQRN